MAAFDTITGVIARRVLLNYRIDQDIARELLPSIFKPQLYQRYAIGGICLIQFEDVRSNFLPIWMAPGTNTASYRIAVKWEENGVERTGNYVPRRESNSFLFRPLGDRAFPRIFSRSRFEIEDSNGQVRIQARGVDDFSELEFRGRIQSEMTENSVFSSVHEAVDFFREDTISYFPTFSDGLFRGRETTGLYHGMELESAHWALEPMRIEAIDSSFLSDRRIFPPGSIEFDSAFVVRNIEHAWNTRPAIQAGPDPMRFCEPIAFTGLSA